MAVYGWGNYPKIENVCHTYRTSQTVEDVIKRHGAYIPRGNGRSYGDSAMAPHIVSYTSKNFLLDFDEENGILHCEAGVMLDDILDVFVPRGWFLSATPGTKRITVGGAIAADVHGKNHHVAGTFSQSVIDFKLLLPDGSVRICSRNENKDLYRATCGGMGLTGLILQARIRLKKIKSAFIDQTVARTKNLEDTFLAFEKYRHVPYSVAWIDCLTGGKKLGRAILNIGDHATDGGLNYRDKTLLKVPLNFPAFSLNSISVRLFNTLYYHKAPARIARSRASIDNFFYPLDILDEWNKIYGKRGFIQYQFVLPMETSYTGLKKILEKISDSGKGSFLAVLKLFGEANDNWLSFPMKGYTLALDFKVEPSLFSLLDELDRIVLDHGGRFYLAKDSRLSREVFEKGYPRIEDFRRLRKKLGLDKAIRSLQSDRLGL